MTTTTDGVAVRRLLDFVNSLRLQGYRIGVGEMVDLFELLTSGRPGDPLRARHGMRALCCRNRDEWREFDSHFDQFWFPRSVEQIPVAIRDGSDPAAAGHGLTGLSGTSSRQPESTHGQSHIEGSGAGRQRTLGKADFRFLKDRGAMREVETLAEQLGGGLRRRLGRRHEPSTRVSELDIRRTMRRSLVTGGLHLKPAWSSKKPAPLKLVVLHDVSHSMTWNNPLLFRFVRGIIQRFHDAVAFAFHTHLFEVTPFFRERSLARMSKRLDARENLWLGGTCIARSLAEFNDRHRRVVRSDTHVIVVSDGFDTDDPEQLRRELKILSSRCRQIIWLHPMLGRQGVTLTQEKLAEQLPMVDRFLPANNLDGLRLAIDALARPDRKSRFSGTLVAQSEAG